MNILEDVINKIKQFFSRNKTKALIAGEEPTQYIEEYLVTQKTKVYSAKEALKQNWVLGEQERLTNESIEKESNEAREIFSNFIDSKFEYDMPLERAAIIVDQSSEISDIIGSYIEAKIVSNRLDYGNIDIHSDEIISFIKLLEGMDFSRKQYDKEADLEEQEILKQLSSEQLEVFSTLDASQLHAFMVLGESSKSRLIEKGIQDPTYLREMRRAISIYMKRPHENVEYNMYKKFLSTEERRKISGNSIRFCKIFFR